MLNDVVTGISIRLHELFGDTHKIYTENVEQGLTAPCFFIKTLPTIHKPLLGKRSQRTYSFVISYFPKEGNEEMMKVSEQLLDGLEYITLLSGEMIRGRSMEAEIVDDVLHFSVNYIVFVNNYVREESMDTLSSNVGTKGVTNGN